MTQSNPETPQVHKQTFHAAMPKVDEEEEETGGNVDGEISII